MSELAGRPLTGPEARAFASGMLARVAVAEGTGAELLALIEDAIRAVTAVADRTEDEIDRLSVLRMNSPLRLLAGPPPQDQPSSGVVLGVAAWDGTLLYDEEHITGPLQRMFDHSGTRHDEPTLRRYRYALSELMQQNSHLLTTGGASYADSAPAWLDPAVRLLELGVTEAWTARHLDEYIDAIQAEPVAPGLKQVRLPVSYPSYVPAAEALATGIAGRAGVDADQVLRRLNNVPPAGKAIEAATILLVAGDLAAVVPPPDRPAVAESVARAIQAPLFAMATLDATASPEPAILAASATAGEQALQAAEAEIAATRSRYRG